MGVLTKRHTDSAFRSRDEIMQSKKVSILKWRYYLLVTCACHLWVLTIAIHLLIQGDRWTGTVWSMGVYTPYMEKIVIK